MGAFPVALDAGSLTDVQAWREVLAEAFVPLDTTPLGDESALTGRVLARPVADLQLSVVAGSRQVVRRTRGLIRRSEADLCKVGVQLRGDGVVEQDGRSARLRPGDLAVYDTDRPYELAFERDFEMLVLVVPRARLEARARSLGDRTAVAIPGTHGSGALASSLLRGLDRTAAPEPEAAHLSDAAVDLVAACLAVGAPQPASETVVLAAQRYLTDHLGDPGLNPARVAAAVHVSLRHLQKLFERRGLTITGSIRDGRLERCRRDLRDPRLADRPVAAIAASWGLVDAAQFSRSFRARYGAAPSQYRAEG
ncbi:helix-turn-helix domain-containing protein [Amycolatopsis acidicola]|uniref:Helix-turn-helix domain-containing protein n=1 Tax=Amycolatopsis acidicola TaxID=2596893 RepID=A0A5N0UXF6_9PSEU|nr:helix-turn-helix domain-containing protein [Amycolatopsis acidicola]KAA9158116.1 helix-turn-helix domain-containing protein [Amycolatopsis acidicola]